MELHPPAPIPKDAVVEYRSDGTVRSITANDLSAEFSHETTYTSHLQERAFPELAAYILRQYGPLLKIENTSTELTLSENKTDSLGYRQVRFHQEYNQVPIIASEVIVHFNASDVPYLINGSYLQTPKQFNTSPKLSTQDALQSIEKEFPKARIDEPDGPAIWINEEGQPVLVYLVSIRQSAVETYRVLIDASDGAVLDKLATTYSRSP